MVQNVFFGFIIHDATAKCKPDPPKPRLQAAFAFLFASRPEPPPLREGAAFRRPASAKYHPRKNIPEPPRCLAPVFFAPPPAAPLRRPALVTPRLSRNRTGQGSRSAFLWHLANCHLCWLSLLTYDWIRACPGKRGACRHPARSLHRPLFFVSPRLLFPPTDLLRQNTAFPLAATLNEPGASLCYRFLRFGRLRQKTLRHGLPALPLAHSSRRHTEKLRIPVISHGFPLSSRIVPRVAFPFLRSPVTPGGILHRAPVRLPAFCRNRVSLSRRLCARNLPCCRSAARPADGQGALSPPPPFFAHFPGAFARRHVCEADVRHCPFAVRPAFFCFPPNITQEYALHAKAGDFFAKYRILPPQTAENT